MTPRHPVAGALRRLATLAAVASLGACAAATPTAPAVARVPADQLYAQIAELQHVTGSTVTYTDEVGTGPMYSGEVSVDAEVDPACVLDDVFAILWQGRYGNLRVGVLQGERYVEASALGLGSFVTAPKEWTARYGDHASPPATPAPRVMPTPGQVCG